MTETGTVVIRDYERMTERAAMGGLCIVRA